MFTGLVETLGTVRRLDSDGRGGTVLAIAESGIAPQLVIGESVAVNGACLTVVSIEADTFHFHVGPETLARTNLGALHLGDHVNLERSLRVGDRLGGHFVQGHIDAVCTIVERRPSGEWDEVWFACPAELTRFMVPRGSIAVDGISLTLVAVEEARFRVMLIPHTQHITTLGFKSVGDQVNLEADILAKHTAKLLGK